MNKFLILSAFLLSACGGGPLTTTAPDPATLAPVIEAEAPPENIRQPALVTSLMTLSPSEVIVRMGSPSLVRRDGLGQVMLFEHATCVFDVVFYTETIETPYSVTHINARTPLGVKIDKQQCLTVIKPGGFENMIANQE